jgi:uncharacterized membrane protein
MKSNEHTRGDNPQSALVALIYLMAFGGAFIIYTARYLPDGVATHFNTAGRADGWMSRTLYTWFTLLLQIALPALIGYLVNTLPQRLSHWTNIPYREYWLAPERLNASVSFLAAQGYRLGCLIVMLTLGLHYVVLVANQQTPPLLPARTFLAVVGAFFIVLFLWVIKLFQRFSKPGRAA